jgi:transposase-like protein
VLGLWIEQTEGAKFWLKVMNELKARGVADILTAVVDGLTGFPEAIGVVFPQTTVQTCIVHLIRNSLALVSWKDRKQVLPDVRAIYRAETAEAAAARLAEFEVKWAARYPAIGPTWRRALGPRGSEVRVSAGDPSDDLHHERGGEPASQPAQDHQDAGQLSER